MLFKLLLCSYVIIGIFAAPQCSNIDDNKRIDCFPDKYASQDKCAKRGCCWRLPDHQTGNIPYCFYPSNFKGYNISKVFLRNSKTTLQLNRLIPSGFPNDINLVHLEVIPITDTLLRIKLIDPNNKRFEPQFPKLNIPETQIKNPSYDVHVNIAGNLIVTRKATGKTIFSIDVNKLIYSNQFHQVTSELPANFVYGLGEHKDHFQKNVNWKRYTFFNRDIVPTENEPLYGSHPFYFTVEDNSTYASGVFLFNSNAMDVFLSPYPAITYRPIGGILDFYVIVGESAPDVVSQYIQLVGLPPIPPLWTLGFHLSRYGYNSLSNMVQAWNRTKNAKIPFDVQWSDIDYMKNNNDFTYDEVNFKGLPQFVEKLHRIGMHFVIILDPGVPPCEPANTYPPYDDGIKMDIFIKHSNGDVLVGKVWNNCGKTVFPDFTNPNASDYWLLQAKQFYSKVKYDGLWIDMNEISNFIDGSDRGCPDSPLENPPYEPGYLQLRKKSICMTAKTFAGDYYDTHNLYSTYETFATHKALLQIRPGKRPFILSRSTFSGQGKYGNHWTGDVDSSWDDLRFSIPSILDFNVFGIPFVGADICGFRDSTTEELCARWMSLGAFYPFSRNHNTIGVRDQDPAALGPRVISASKKALNIRYTLIPYLYTLFYRAHNFGETVARPMFFNFPKDSKTYSIENQFMWGPHILIIPVLEQGSTSVNGYLPAGRWWTWNTTSVLESHGEFINFNTKLDEINILVRQGAVIPFSDEVMMTKELHDSNFNLLVTLDKNNEASGELYWDDGDSIDTQKEGKYNLIQFKVNRNTLIASLNHVGHMVKKYISSIVVCGMNAKPLQIYLDGQTISFDFNVKSMCFRAHLNGSLKLFRNFALWWKFT